MGRHFSHSFQHHLHWCIIGDLNAIAGAHEHNGAHSLNCVHMSDFKSWSDQNNLVDYPTHSPLFTWHNGRIGRGLVERRLDRDFGNQLQFSLASSMSISSLDRLRSDHNPLLLEVRFGSSFHVSSFKFLSIWTLHEDCKYFIANVWSTKVIG